VVGKTHATKGFINQSDQPFLEVFLMKKLLGLVSVVAVAGAINVASAMDRTGKIGLGFQESFTSSGSFAGAPLGSWSVKYGVNSNVNAQFAVGFAFGNKGFNKMANFGARVLYDLVEMENSDFYTGLGIGWNQDKNVPGGRVLRFQIPLGYEFSFAGLPEIGFSAEAGAVYDYVKDGSQSQFQTVGGNVGGNLGLGVHYYF
jgi:hypothetical protein